MSWDSTPMLQPSKCIRVINWRADSKCQNIRTVRFSMDDDHGDGTASSSTSEGFEEVSRRRNDHTFTTFADRGHEYHGGKTWLSSFQVWAPWLNISQHPLKQNREKISTCNDSNNHRGKKCIPSSDCSDKRKEKSAWPDRLCRHQGELQQQKSGSPVGKTWAV